MERKTRSGSGMAGRDPFQSGTRIQVFHKTEWLSCTALIGETGKDFFTITFSPAGRRKPEMPPGSTWMFCLLREEGLYRFSAPVMECITRPGALPVYRVARPSLMQRQQRRRFVRLSCNLSALYWRLERKFPHPTGKRCAAGLLSSMVEQQPGTEARVLNISGGGLKLLAPEHLPLGTRLLLQLQLDAPEARMLVAEGIIERVQPVDPKYRNRFQIGVSFSAIHRGARERIIRYIFRRLRCRFR